MRGNTKSDDESIYEIRLGRDGGPTNQLVKIQPVVFHKNFAHLQEGSVLEEAINDILKKRKAT